MLDVDLRSPGTVIRDAVIDCIDGLALLKTMRKVPTFQWQPDEVGDGSAACGVYFLRSEDRSQGATTGEPHFDGLATIGISILVRPTDPNFLADLEDGYVEAIQAAILTDPDFFAICRRDAGMEGIESLTRSPVYPANGAAYMSETRLELIASYQKRWEPVVRDEFLRVILRTKISTASSAAPQVAAVIDVREPQN